MSLTAGGSVGFLRQVNEALVHLDPQAEVINGRVYLDASVEVRHHTLGHSLLRQLIQSPYQTHIVEGRVSNCDATTKNGGATGSRVIWNPRQIVRHASHCMCIGLGHELCHALQLTQGLVSSSDFYPARGRRVGFSIRVETLAITGTYGSQSWRRNAVTENNLRSEHIPRNPPRPTY